MTWLLSSLSVLPLPVSGQEIPTLGRVSDVLWSKSDELDIGKAAYDRLREQGNIYDSQADLDYLSYLGNKVATSADTRVGLTFYLTRSLSINAFATPGGYVGVNAGLVLATDNEHELAGVLAHEVAHVAREHIARTVLAAKDRRVANMAAMVAGVLMATQGDGQLGVSAVTAIVAGEKQQQINDIRRHEIEADRLGRRLMTQAGFNVLGMQTFFGKLYAPSGKDSVPAFLLTHPLPQARQAAIDTLKKRSKKLRSRNEYYLFRARLRAKFLPKNEVTALIRTERQSQKPAVRDAAAYLAALQALQLGQIGSASKQLSRMKTGMRKNRDVRLLQAKLNLLSGKAERTRATYRQLWRQYTGDTVVAYDYAQFLRQRNDLRKAKNILSQSLESAALNPQLYWLYGKILGQLGETVEQHSVLIRYYRQSGQYQHALMQAQIAAKLPGLDWQSRAGFEAQEKALKRLVKRLQDN